MNLNKSFLIKRILPIAAGALLGYAYYYFIGCNSGTCPITSNPLISTLYGSIMGFIIAMPGKNTEKSNEKI